MRTYAATVAPGGGWSGDRPPGGLPPNTSSFFVTVSGASFREDLLPYRDAFWIRVAGDYLALGLGDHGRPGLVEQAAPNTYLALGGRRGLSQWEPPCPGSRLPFAGFVDYCAMRSEMSGRATSAIQAGGWCTPAAIRVTSWSSRGDDAR